MQEETHTRTHTHKYMPPQLEVHSCCCLPCRDQKNILYTSPGENLPSHNKHKPSAQFEAPLWVVSVAAEAKVSCRSPASWQFCAQEMQESLNEMWNHKN